MAITAPGFPGGSGPDLATKFVVPALVTAVLGVVAVYGVVIRGPLYSPTQCAKSAPEWQIPPNLLTTTLVQVVANPFAPVDLPLNRRVINVPQFDPPNFALTVLPLQAAPFRTADLAITRRVVNVPQFDAPNILIGQTTTATPFQPYDWTGPGRARNAPQFDVGNAFLPTAVVFTPTDWTVPGKARSAADWSIGQNLVLLTAKPFSPVDWGNLSQQARQQVGSFEPPNALISTLTIPALPPALVVNFDWRPTQSAWQPFLDTIPNLLTSTFNPTSPPIPPVIDEDQHTPGRIIRPDWELSKEQVESRENAKRGRVKEVEKQTKKLTTDSSEVSDQLASVQTEIATLLAQLEAEGIKRTLIEQAALEKALLLAQQQQLLLAVQQAVLLEEMEIIDIAYIALVAWQYTNS